MISRFRMIVWFCRFILKKLQDHARVIGMSKRLQYANAHFAAPLLNHVWRTSQVLTKMVCITLPIQDAGSQREILIPYEMRISLSLEESRPRIECEAFQRQQDGSPTIFSSISWRRWSWNPLSSSTRFIEAESFTVMYWDGRSVLQKPNRGSILVRLLRPLSLVLSTLICSLSLISSRSFSLRHFLFAFDLSLSFIYPHRLSNKKNKGVHFEAETNFRFGQKSIKPRDIHFWNSEYFSFRYGMRKSQLVLKYSSIHFIISCFSLFRASVT